MSPRLPTIHVLGTDAGPTRWARHTTHEYPTTTLDAADAIILCDSHDHPAHRILKALPSHRRSHTIVVTPNTHPLYQEILVLARPAAITPIDAPILLGAVHGAANGQRILPPGGLLTRREADVLALLLDGHDTNTAAAKLGIANKTLNSHVSNVLRRVGLPSRGALFGQVYAGARAPA